jgi:hypothetical protein
MPENPMSNHPYGQDIRADLPPTRPPDLPPVMPPTPPTRRSPLRRLLRGAIIGLIMGGFIGALQGLAFHLMSGHVGSGRVIVSQSSEETVRFVLERTLAFALLGALLVGVSQLLFGERTTGNRDDRKS